jgi:hypothetical protein
MQNCTMEVRRSSRWYSFEWGVGALNVVARGFEIERDESAIS